MWNCYSDEINYNDDDASDGKSFKYKTKIIEIRPTQGGDDRYTEQ